MGNLAGFKDIEKLAAQIVPLPTCDYSAPQLTNAYAGVFTSGEELALFVAPNGGSYLACDRVTLLPIAEIGGLGMGMGALIEASPGIAYSCQNSSWDVYMRNHSKQTKTVENTALTPFYGYQPTMTTSDGSYKESPTNAINSGNQQYFLNRFSNARFRISPPAANTTYPSVADPGALAGFASNGVTASGGVLAATTHYAKLCWLTKTNTTRTKYGITLPSNAISVAASANDAWNLDIPSLPTDAIGYAIFHSTDGTNYYLIGASTTTGTAAFTIKAAYSQLAATGTVFNGKGGLDKTLFASNCSHQDVSAAIPGTSNLPAWSTTNFVQTSDTAYGANPVFSPWQRDTSFLLKPISSGVSAGGTMNVDKMSLIGAAHSLNQASAVGATGLPRIPVSGSVSGTFIMSLPELAAYAILSNPTYSSNGLIVRVFSYITGEQIWAFHFPLPTNVSLATAYHSCSGKMIDFQEIDGTVYLIANLWWLRSAARFPVRIAP